MPYESAPLLRFTSLSELPPGAIEQRLGNLIRLYVQRRSPAIARSVVVHIEALCSHPGFESDSTERCAYLRLRAHWCWLADLTRDWRARPEPPSRDFSLHFGS